jgi:hypothetical protein
MWSRLYGYKRRRLGLKVMKRISGHTLAVIVLAAAVSHTDADTTW